MKRTRPRRTRTEIVKVDMPDWKTLQRFSGQWTLLLGRRVIAHNRDIAQISASIPEGSVLYFVPGENTYYF